MSAAYSSAMPGRPSRLPVLHGIARDELRSVSEESPSLFSEGRQTAGHGIIATLPQIWENVLMRLLLAIVFLSVRLLACSCAGPAGTPCSGAGMSTAVFTGKVLEIADPPP